MAAEFGTIQMSYDGEVVRTVGSFNVNMGRPKREVLVGSDGVHDAKQMPQAPFIEGEIRVPSYFDLEKFLDADDMTVTLRMPRQTYTLTGGTNTTEGTLATEDGNLSVKIEGRNMERFTNS